MKRATGIGGIFFKCKDPKAVNEWYQKHLGVEASPYGAQFHWKNQEEAHKEGYTLWSPFPEETTYFGPPSQDFMINYTVENLEALVEELKKEGVAFADGIAVYDYGKFVHIFDCEGNKVELWEPSR